MFGKHSNTSMLDLFIQSFVMTSIDPLQLNDVIDHRINRSIDHISSFQKTKKNGGNNTIY